MSIKMQHFKKNFKLFLNNINKIWTIFEVKFKFQNIICVYVYKLFNTFQTRPFFKGSG